MALYKVSRSQKKTYLFTARKNQELCTLATYTMSSPSASWGDTLDNLAILYGFVCHDQKRFLAFQYQIWDVNFRLAVVAGSDSSNSTIWRMPKLPLKRWIRSVLNLIVLIWFKLQYLMHQRLLKCAIIPKDKIHEDLWKGKRAKQF